MAPTLPSIAAVQAAIPGALARTVTAWAANDADAFADSFVEDGVVLLPDALGAGRAEIRTLMAGRFAGPYLRTWMRDTPVSVTALGPDVVVVRTAGGLATSPAGEPGCASRTTWVVVERSDGWRLALFQRTPADPVVAA